MIDKRCFLGFHDWEFKEGKEPLMYVYGYTMYVTNPTRTCKRCSKVQYLIHPAICGGNRPRWDNVDA